MSARLIGSARRSWASFDGWAAAHLGGRDPLGLPADRMLNLIYHWLTNGASEAELKKFDTRLWVPPKGVAPAAGSPWSAEAETASLKSFASAFASSAPAGR